MNFKIVTVVIIAVCLCINAEFPDEPKPCKYGDTACILTTINYLFKEKSHGDASMNLPQLNPLKFDEVHMQQGEDSPVTMELVLKNNSMYGLDTAKAVKIKGFGKDLTKKHRLIIHADYLSVVGDYDINGNILILPIKGSGKSNITMVDVDLIMNFVGTALEKGGATYMHIEQLNVNAEPKSMIYKVDNLFNGDQALGDNMNLFLNENWQEIYAEVRTSISKSYSEIFKEVISGVFSKYPYDKYFIE